MKNINMDHLIEEDWQKKLKLDQEAFEEWLNKLNKDMEKEYAMEQDLTYMCEQQEEQ